MEYLHSSPRRIVSYFEHELIPGYPFESAVRDVEEIKAFGFTNVVLCLTETDIATPKRMDFLRGLVEVMHAQGLEVWADPWRVGSVFGGEAVSHFERSGQKSCLCNPALDTLVQNWLRSAANLQVDAIFWDEPEMKCDDHQGRELAFLERYTREAAKLLLPSVVCLCADARKVDQLAQVAALPDVLELATDPYYPNAFEDIPHHLRLGYVAEWARYTKEPADAYGKRCHVWVQGFDIAPDDIDMPVAFAETIRENGVPDIAFWGYKACQSVPQFVGRYGREHLDRVWREVVPRVFQGKEKSPL